MSLVLADVAGGFCVRGVVGLEYVDGFVWVGPMVERHDAEGLAIVAQELHDEVVERPEHYRDFSVVGANVHRL